MSGFDYNEWKRAWRRANADHYRKQARDYYAEKRETERARARARYAASADKNSDRYRNRDPEKVRARWSVQQAIRSGQLVREPCQECGSSENVHAHHEDYSRPLDVRWLCSICHGALHAAHRRTLA